MRFFRRALTGLFLFAVTLGLLAMAGQTIFGAIQDRMSGGGGGMPARERVFSAEVAPIVIGAQTPILTAFGEIRSRRTLELRAPAEGTVIALSPSFEEGGAVTAGEVLMRIDPTQADSALASARTNLRDAEAELADAARAVGLAGEDVAAARRQAELRDRALDRQNDLLSRGVGSAASDETAELAAATAAAAGAQARLRCRVLGCIGRCIGTLAA